MNSECIKILYNWIFCSIILEDTTGTYHIIQIKSHIFNQKEN